MTKVTNDHLTLFSFFSALASYYVKQKMKDLPIFRMTAFNTAQMNRTECKCMKNVNDVNES